MSKSTTYMYRVDLPDPHDVSGEWIEVGNFDTIEGAKEFLSDTVGIGPNFLEDFITQWTKEISNPEVGQEVTITPRVTFSADRDTEPGAQPWKAKCVGYTDTQIIIVSDLHPDEIRPIDRELVSWR